MTIGIIITLEENDSLDSFGPHPGLRFEAMEATEATSLCEQIMCIIHTSTTTYFHHYSLVIPTLPYDH